MTLTEADAKIVTPRRPSSDLPGWQNVRTLLWTLIGRQGESWSSGQGLSIGMYILYYYEHQRFVIDCLMKLSYAGDHERRNHRLEASAGSEKSQRREQQTAK